MMSRRGTPDSFAGSFGSATLASDTTAPMGRTSAIAIDKLLHRPHVPMLEERNTRKGFFELEMLHGVLARLPESLRPAIEFAYITGWRIPSEVLTLERRQIDFKAGEVRLDPETKKNRAGRVFPMN